MYYWVDNRECYCFTWLCQKSNIGCVTSLQGYYLNWLCHLSSSRPEFTSKLFLQEKLVLREYCAWSCYLSSSLLSRLTGLLSTRTGWQKEEMTLGSTFVLYDIEYFSVLAIYPLPSSLHTEFIISVNEDVQNRKLEPAPKELTVSVAKGGQ